MFAVPATRQMRAVGVLLGGSGRARPLSRRTTVLAALLRPWSAASVQSAETHDKRAAQGVSC